MRRAVCARRSSDPRAQREPRGAAVIAGPAGFEYFGLLFTKCLDVLGFPCRTASPVRRGDRTSLSQSERCCLSQRQRFDGGLVCGAAGVLHHGRAQLAVVPPSAERSDRLLTLVSDSMGKR